MYAVLLRPEDPADQSPVPPLHCSVTYNGLIGPLDRVRVSTSSGVDEVLGVVNVCVYVSMSVKVDIGLPTVGDNRSFRQDKL